MLPEISVLLAHEDDEPLESLRMMLERQHFQTRRARSCEELARFLNGTKVHHLVFTDTVLPDGTWADVLSLAASAPEPLSVIVVSRLVDIKLYIEAIECGAFDFIVPPFDAPELDHVVRCAAWNTSSHRAALAHAA